MTDPGTVSSAAFSLRATAHGLDELIGRLHSTATWKGPAGARAAQALTALASHRCVSWELQRVAAALETFEPDDEWSAWIIANALRAVLFPRVMRLASDGRSILADTFQDIGNDGPPKDHFRIIETNTHPPRLIIVLAGVQDLTSSLLSGAAAPVEVARRRNDTPRDLAVAIPQVFSNGGDYVERVERGVRAYLQARHMGADTEVVIIGHSHGAITAVDLAGRASFNGGTVRVTHVIAAGGGQGGHLDEPRLGTDLLVLTNTADLVSRAIAATDINRAAYVGTDRRLEVTRWAGIGTDAGHDLPRYEGLAKRLTGRGRALVDDAFSALAGVSVQVTDVSLLTP